MLLADTLILFRIVTIIQDTLSLHYHRGEQTERITKVGVSWVHTREFHLVSKFRNFLTEATHCLMTMSFYGRCSNNIMTNPWNHATCLSHLNARWEFIYGSTMTSSNNFSVEWLVYFEHSMSTMRMFSKYFQTFFMFFHIISYLEKKKKKLLKISTYF